MSHTGPHILIIDPSPQRTTLPALLEADGVRCTVAHGLHDAMVQSILRHPSLVLADLTLAGACGVECRTRLAELPHFAQVIFLTIGDPTAGPDDYNCPADVSVDTLHQQVLMLARQLAEPPAVTAPEPTPHTPDRREQRLPTLVEILAQLKQRGTDGTVVVAGPEYRYGEVLVRGGLPIHAVTHSGDEGENALAAMAEWPRVRIEVGPPPRPETPVTIPPPPVTPQPPPALDTSATQALLAELEGLGILRKLVATE